MNIKFDCFCGQPIEVNSDSGGQKFNCPSCGTSLTVPIVKGVTHVPQPPFIPQLPTSHTYPTNQIVTIQKTNKEWKVLQLLGVLLFIVGILFCFINGILGGLTLLLSIRFLIVSRIGAWWTNG